MKTLHHMGLFKIDVLTTDAMQGHENVSTIFDLVLAKERTGVSDSSRGTSSQFWHL